MSATETPGFDRPVFDRFVAIDWTGAVGERHRAIAIAEADADGGAPRLITPPRPWSRGEVLALVAGWQMRGERVLVGFDMCFGLPFADAGGYFPGAASPPDARALWREVAAVCAGDAHLAAPSYVAHRRRHFWLGAADGPRGERARLRVVEALDRARGNTPSSAFVLLGAAQCGKASLSGMRLLDALDGVAVWPFGSVPVAGPCVVEIYCRLFAQRGGARGKLRNRAALDTALVAMGSPACGVAVPETFDDHIGDALISAAGMRAVSGEARFWQPPDLTPAVAATEGWTFGLA